MIVWTPEERDGGVWLGGYDIKPLLDRARAAGAAAGREAIAGQLRSASVDYEAKGQFRESHALLDFAGRLEAETGGG